MNERQKIERSQQVQAKGLQKRGGDSTEQVHRAAESGLSGGGGAMPFADRIQESFGSFDVSGIRAHTGGAAQKANEQMGSMAYATGNNVAFRGAPDLFTAAHEAAHVIQQQAGVQLRGGVGEVGDRYERHADEVAARVVQGKSAEDLLTQFTGRGAKAPVQARSQTQKKLQHRAKAGRRGGVQMRRPIQRRAFPSGSTVTLLNPIGNSGAIFAGLRQLKGQIAGGAAMPDFEGQLAAQIENAIGPSGPRSFNFEIRETRGMNMTWRGSVRVDIGEPTSGAARNTTVNAGGSAGQSDQHSSGSQHTQGTSGSVTGGYEPGDSGGASGSATVGATDEQQTTRGRQATASTGDTATGDIQNTSQNMTATMRAHLTLEGVLTGHWSDIVNPVMWGAHAADAILDPGRKSKTVDNCGTVTWVQRNGMR